MKEKYVVPAVEIIAISSSDIITESGCTIYDPNCRTKLPDIDLGVEDEG